MCEFHDNKHIKEIIKYVFQRYYKFSLSPKKTKVIVGTFMSFRRNSVPYLDSSAKLQNINLLKIVKHIFQQFLKSLPNVVKRGS